MAKQVRLLNKLGWNLAVLLTVAGCQQKTTATIAIPNVFVSSDRLDWQHQDGRLLLNNSPFSGWQYQLWSNGDTAFVGAFSHGKAEGFHRRWHKNHQPKEVRHYHNGWQEGEQNGWYESGERAFVYHFRNDVYEGSLREWYPNGQLARDGTYHDGQEDGPQRQWFAEGVLKANYVTRNGRNYGFTGVKNCVNVWDSISVSH